MDAKLTFEVRYQIFYQPYSKLSGEERIRKYKKMAYGGILKDLFQKNFGNGILGKYKFLDGYDPAISSLDETKQLTLVKNRWQLYNSENFMTFSTEHSSVTDYFTLEELFEVTYIIKDILQKHLGYKIEGPEYILHRKDVEFYINKNGDYEE